MAGDPIQAFRASIVGALGYAPAVIEPGRLQRFATRDRRRDNAGWCLLFEDLRGGVYGCNRTGVRGSWAARDRLVMTPGERAELARRVEAASGKRQAQQRERWKENAQRIARMWAQCEPVTTGDPCALYLMRRGFHELRTLPEVLRYHPAMPYWDDGEKLGTFPALVAPIVAPDGRMLALHRTYLTDDGRKAAVPSPKKLSATAGLLTGGCIPLHDPAQDCVGIAEGIETALAAWCASGVPTVAAYCAGNLAAWQWPASVRRIVIFADADKAGREAADTLRARAKAEGMRVDMLTPSDPGSDWCDVWARRDAALAVNGGAA